MLGTDFKALASIANLSNLQSSTHICRTFRLLPGESLELSSGHDASYIFALQGECSVENSKRKRRIDLQSSMAAPFKLTGGEMTHVTVSEEVLLFHVGAEGLDSLLSLSELSSDATSDTLTTLRRLEKLQQTVAFRRLPAESARQALERMQTIELPADEVIVKQGEVGDAFYMIDRGRAEVWQTGIYDDEPQLVSELEEGDCFGEEALITGGTRSATVKLTQDSKLLKLSKEHFNQLVTNPLVKKVGSSPNRVGKLA